MGLNYQAVQTCAEPLLQNTVLIFYNGCPLSISRPIKTTTSESVMKALAKLRHGFCPIRLFNLGSGVMGVLETAQSG